jgi:DNA-binding XRE family transcriptional regulator
MGVMPTAIYRLESEKNNSSLDKVIQYLNAINLKISLVNKKTNERFLISQYKDVINWLTNSRKPDYTQRSLAEKVSCSYIAIAHIESEKSVVSVDIFLRLVDSLGFEVELSPISNK